MSYYFLKKHRLYLHYLCFTIFSTNNSVKKQRTNLLAFILAEKKKDFFVLF